ncbi:MAG: topoisomerase DNA-binding C4 zinc finger domain-containing protein [Bacillus subtilis]|nr:topoisomerase DNA-binding C4 zinc finger domain-containing protein [Bacillus subtilis]
MLDKIADGRGRPARRDPRLLRLRSNRPMKTRVNDMDKLAPAKKPARTARLCGTPMVYRRGRYGEFEGCGDYPPCKYVEAAAADRRAEGEGGGHDTSAVPKCRKCTLVVRVGLERARTRATSSYACRRFPEMPFHQPRSRPIGPACPRCRSRSSKTRTRRVRCIDADTVRLRRTPTSTSSIRALRPGAEFSFFAS